MFTYSFEKLEVWQLSRELTKDVYSLTKKFPDEEKYGLTNQIRRSSISISSNLAEGSSRKSKKDQARFTQIAFSSLLEMLNQLIISHDLEYIEENDLKQIRPKIEFLSNKLNSFYNSQMNSSNPQINSRKLSGSTNQRINKSTNQHVN